MFKNKNYILEIYREGSFSKAAQNLFISQPSLSASVKRIEEKIGFLIFDRSTTPLTLTETGQEYIKYALEIESKEKDFEKYISDNSNLLTGTIKIGASTLFTSYVIPGLISKFKKRYGEITFEIFENNTQNLMQLLSEGKIDVMIDNTKIKDENIVSRIYSPETLLLAVPKEFPVNERVFKKRLLFDDILKGTYLKADMGVSLKEFGKCPFVVLKSPNDTGQRAERLFKSQHIAPEIVFSVDQQLTAYNIACSGMGISFVSDTLIKKLKTRQSVYYYAIDDKAVTRNIYLYMKKNRYVTKCCAKFTEFAINHS